MSDHPPRLPLVLLPGLGTNEQLFSLQRTAFPELLVPPWLTPRWSESLADYARRIAESLPIDGPCVVGGVSFGGLVALEMSRHLQARGCLLISSLKSASEKPLWVRLGGPFAWLLPPQTDRVISAIGWMTLKCLGRWLPSRARGVCQHLSKTRSQLLPWAARAAARWNSPGDWPCRVFQIHGQADPIFPLRFVHPDRVIPGGGHLLTLTHPFVVNAFIQDCLQQLEAGPE